MSLFIFSISDFWPMSGLIIFPNFYSISTVFDSTSFAIFYVFLTPTLKFLKFSILSPYLTEFCFINSIEEADVLLYEDIRYYIPVYNSYFVTLECTRVRNIFALKFGLAIFNISISLSIDFLDSTRFPYRLSLRNSKLMWCFSPRGSRNGSPEPDVLSDLTVSSEGRFHVVRSISIFKTIYGNLTVLKLRLC